MITNDQTAINNTGNNIIFYYTDSFTNEGSGTITLNGDTIHLFVDPEGLPNTGFGVFGDCDLEKQ